MPLLATNNTKGACSRPTRSPRRSGPKGGKVAIVAFHAGSQTNDQRVQGFMKGLKKHPKLKLVDTQYSENDYNQALTVTQNILTAHPDLKGIFAANEASDVGAVEAVRMSKKLGKVKLVGWDTSPDEVEGVTAGDVYALVSQDPFRMGYDGVDVGGEGDPAAPHSSRTRTPAWCSSPARTSSNGACSRWSRRRVDAGERAVRPARAPGRPGRGARGRLHGRQR